MHIGDATRRVIVAVGDITAANEQLTAECPYPLSSALKAVLGASWLPASNHRHVPVIYFWSWATAFSATMSFVELANVFSALRAASLLIPPSAQIALTAMARASSYSR